VVDRTDAAPAFVRRLREQGHGARLLDVRHGDLGGPHDAILANAVLLHLDRQAAALALAACRDAVRPGGLLALTLKEGDGEAWSSAKLQAPRWFVYWRKDALQDLLAAAAGRCCRSDRCRAGQSRGCTPSVSAERHPDRRVPGLHPADAGTDLSGGPRRHDAR
jgi:hypothetical protein